MAFLAIAIAMDMKTNQRQTGKIARQDASYNHQNDMKTNKSTDVLNSNSFTKRLYLQPDSHVLNQKKMLNDGASIVTQTTRTGISSLLPPFRMHE